MLFKVSILKLLYHISKNILKKQFSIAQPSCSQTEHETVISFYPHVVVGQHLAFCNSR